MVVHVVGAQFRPYDITSFRSRDAAAAVLLANSLGWRIIIRENGPVALVADDGKQIRVPDNTGIKMDIFRGWIHQIATHSGDKIITNKLVHDIVHATKLNREHARLLYDLVEDEGQPEPDNEPITVEPDTYGLVPKPDLPRGAEPYILSREPFVNSQGKNTGTCYVRTWSDDHVDYQCTICDRVYDTIKGVGAHRQWHIGRGEVEGREIKHRPDAKFIRTYDTSFKAEPQRGTRAKPPEPLTEKMVEISEEFAAEAISAVRILTQIRELLGADEVSALKRLLEERDERIARLEGNLRTFRDLLDEDL